MKRTHRLKVALLSTASCALVLAGAATGGQTAVAGSVKAADTFRQCMAKAGTTLAMETCVIAEQQRVDAELNTVGQQIVKHLSPSRTARFVKVQQRWVAYRDSECEFAASEVAAGSLATVVGGECLIDLTVQRTNVLRKRR